MTARATIRVRLLGGPRDGQELFLERLDPVLITPPLVPPRPDLFEPLQFRPPAPSRPYLDRAVYLRLRHPEARGEDQVYRFSHYE